MASGPLITWVEVKNTGSIDLGAMGTWGEGTQQLQESNWNPGTPRL